MEEEEEEDFLPSSGSDASMSSSCLPHRYPVQKSDRSPGNIRTSDEDRHRMAKDKADEDAFWRELNAGWRASSKRHDTHRPKAHASEVPRTSKNKMQQKGRKGAAAASPTLHKNKSGCSSCVPDVAAEELELEDYMKKEFLRRLGTSKASGKVK